MHPTKDAGETVHGWHVVLERIPWASRGRLPTDPVRSDPYYAPPADGGKVGGVDGRPEVERHSRYAIRRPGSPRTGSCDQRRVARRADDQPHFRPDLERSSG